MAEEVLSEKMKQVREVFNRNVEIIKRMQSYGASPNGTWEARFQMFMEYLAQAGVLTQDQLETFHLMWENALNEQLVMLEVEVMKQIRASRLATPGPPSKLIVPGH